MSARPLPMTAASSSTIEDGGPGVPDADLARLFDGSSGRGRPGEGSRRGMGIGLSIVRGMAEAMGGTATPVASELGGLADRPRRCRAAPGSRPTTTVDRMTDRPGARVLLVEDDERDPRPSVARNLTAHGYPRRRGG